jgi:hypothetical protein
MADIIAREEASSENRCCQRFNAQLVKEARATPKEKLRRVPIGICAAINTAAIFSITSLYLIKSKP